MDTQLDQTITTTTATKKRDRGFTLVELLIVIVILGILSTVTVFAVRGITTTGRTNACATDKRVLDTAFEAFAGQYGTTSIPVGSGPGVLTGIVLGATPEDTLVASGLLKAVSPNWVLAADGSMASQGGTNNCTLTP